MKIFNCIIIVISICIMAYILAFQIYTLMFGKIILAFAAAFLSSAIMHLYEIIKNDKKNGKD